MNKNPLIIVIGAYGSGKSEYSINLANRYKSEGIEKVTLVDLDVVNPYFRSRDVREKFERIGIEVIAPEAQFGHADMPMISPKIKGAISDTSKLVILDVGGDPAGCKALGRFVDDIYARTYTMHFVVNTKRPFTADYYDILNMKNMLESTSRLKITELVCNTNLMQFTNEELISEGIKIIDEVAVKENLKFDTFLVLEDTDNKYPLEINNKRKMNLNYYLSKPWEEKKAVADTL